jgi:hypothetical protein
MNVVSKNIIFMLPMKKAVFWNYGSYMLEKGEKLLHERISNTFLYFKLYKKYHTGNKTKISAGVRRQLKLGQNYTRYFDRLCFTTSDLRYSQLFDLQHCALQNLLTVEAIVQSDMYTTRRLLALLRRLHWPRGW